MLSLNIIIDDNINNNDNNDGDGNNNNVMWVYVARSQGRFVAVQAGFQTRHVTTVAFAVTLHSEPTCTSINNNNNNNNNDNGMMMVMMMMTMVVVVVMMLVIPIK